MAPVKAWEVLGIPAPPALRHPENHQEKTGWNVDPKLKYVQPQFPQTVVTFYSPCKKGMLEA